jgi:antitoxin component YwqK of YwqJK toxin-antitoxin module
MDLQITKRISNFINFLLRPLLLVLVLSASFSCMRSANVEEVATNESKPENVVKRRSDGTVSSVNQVNENNRVHGIRATYYEDGKTLYSKQTFDKGKKQGPATWYYMDDKALLQFYLKPGKVLDRNVDILAEIPTELGNTLARKYSYQLSVSN